MAALSREENGYEHSIRSGFNRRAKRGAAG